MSHLTSISYGDSGRVILSWTSVPGMEYEIQRTDQASLAGNGDQVGNKVTGSFT